MPLNVGESSVPLLHDSALFVKKKMKDEKRVSILKRVEKLALGLSVHFLFSGHQIRCPCKLTHFVWEPQHADAETLPTTTALDEFSPSDSHLDNHDQKLLKEPHASEFPQCCWPNARKSGMFWRKVGSPSPANSPVLYQQPNHCLQFVPHGRIDALQQCHTVL
jgi:hypothetical protein